MSTSVCPFKKGDLIRGKVNGNAIANEDALLKVIDIDEECETIDASLIGHRKKNISKVDGTFRNILWEDYEMATPDFIAEVSPAKPKADVKTLKDYKFDGGFLVKTYEDGSIGSNFNTHKKFCGELDTTRIADLNKVCEGADKAKKEKKNFNLPAFIRENKITSFDDIFGDKVLKDTLKKLLDFFKEFEFVPNLRFVNTLSLKAAVSNAEAKSYVGSYFKLMNNSYALAVSDKVKSPEFDSLLTILSVNTPASQINSRLTVYFGPAGSGKTTQAMKETENRCIVCNSSMLPQDLIEDFEFDDGKPGFNRSMLRKCMENGLSITFDEFNLLGFDSIRFLQGLLDNKKEFTWKGETIKIADGFKVIATMNLVVNGTTFGLPDPIVDRCGDIKEFNLGVDELLRAFD